MTPEERNLITGLFTRLKSADNPQKDGEAEQLIQQSTTAQPSAPYLLVQTVLVQEHALNNAQTRIQQLEKQVAEASATAAQRGQHHEGGVGGFLSGLFGGGHPPGQNTSPAANQTQGRQQPPPQNDAPQAQPPYPTTANMPPGAGGGFLKSALGTAAGVAGGAMLFQGIQNLLGHNAGPFGGGGFGGGGSGFFGGGNSGFGGQPNITEVTNNYIDERGNPDQDSGNRSFLGGESVGFNPGVREDNRYDTGNTDGGGDSGLYSMPPTDDNSGDTDGDGDLYSTPPTDDTDSGSIDNSYDNSDAGGGSSDSSDF